MARVGKGSHDAQDPFPYEGILRRTEALSSELQEFTQHYCAVTDSFTSDGASFGKLMVASLKNQIRSEIEGIEGVIKRVQADDPLAKQALSSTNIPFFEAVWDFAKQCRDIVAFRKWLCNDHDQGRELMAPGHHIVYSAGQSAHGKSKTTTLVDIIADGGRSWVKVCTTNSKRLFWDMTKLGWAFGEDSDEEDDGADESFNDLPIYELAKGLARSAAAYRIRNRHPTVRLVLPRIAEGETKEADSAIAAMRRLGVDVICSNDLDAARSRPLSAERLRLMAPSPFDSFSATLNVDASILIAIISDFSHSEVVKEARFSAMQLGHLTNEGKRNVLKSWLYPSLGPRDLVCTRQAAETTETIVKTLGTETERARWRIVMGLDGCESKRRDELLADLAKLSIHRVPDDVKLPVRVADDGSSTEDNLQQLPGAARQALAWLNEPTKSVFSYGWAKQLTTLTSNGVAINDLTRKLEGLKDGYDGPWPSMWLCPFSRSLVGRPKTKSAEQTRTEIGAEVAG